MPHQESCVLVGRPDLHPFHREHSALRNPTAQRLAVLAAPALLQKASQSRRKTWLLVWHAAEPNLR